MVVYLCFIVTISYVFTKREKETCRTTDRGSIPTEQSNRLRLQHLIEFVAEPAVRVEFDKQFHPDVLQKTIRKGNILKIRNITKNQRELLEPKSGKYMYFRTFEKVVYVVTITNSLLDTTCPYRIKIATCLAVL